LPTDGQQIEARRGVRSRVAGTGIQSAIFYLVISCPSARKPFVVTLANHRGVVSGQNWRSAHCPTRIPELRTLPTNQQQKESPKSGEGECSGLQNQKCNFYVIFRPCAGKPFVVTCATCRGVVLSAKLGIGTPPEPYPKFCTLPTNLQRIEVVQSGAASHLNVTWVRQTEHSWVNAERCNLGRPLWGRFVRGRLSRCLTHSALPGGGKYSHGEN
jgi:hypothetical protein